MAKLTVYTDGSCLGNPGPGGWGFIVVENEKTASEKVVQSQSGHVFHTTNNRMEMTAFLMSLKYLAQNIPGALVEINADSNLLVQTINEGWKRKANPDLWVEIDRYLPKVNFRLFWVKAHADNSYNNKCDELALREAQKAKQMLAKNPTLAPAVISKDEKKPDHSTDDQASLF